MAKTITGIKVGQTTITATYGGVTSNSVTFTVTSIDASLTFAANTSPLEYDGNEKILGTVIYNGDGQAKYYVSTSNSAPSASASGWVNCTDGTYVKATNAGTYYVFLQATNGTNYNSVAVKAGNTTGKVIAQKAVTYKADNQSWVYDGGSHSASNTATLTSGSLVSGHSASFSCSGSVGPNVTSSSGTKTLGSVTIYDGNSNNVTSNYAITKNSGTLNITARPIKVTAGSNSKTYDGTALTYNSATAEATGTNRGLVSGHSMTSYTVTGSQTTYGSSNNVPSGAVIKSGSTDVTSNYNISYVNGTLTVNKCAVTYTATDESWTYDGTSHSASNTASKTGGTLPTGHTATFSCTGSVGPAVGTATKTLSSVTIKNAGGTDVSGSFTITKNNGTLTINARAITFTATNESWVYDATSHSASNTATKTAGSDLVSGHTASFSCTGSVGAAVGSATKTLSSVTIMSGSTNVTSNYSITKNNGTLTVSKRPINVTAGSNSKIYDGTPLTYNSATAESTGTNRGLVSGHSMTSCTVTGTITNVGSVDNVASAAVIKSGSTDVTSNYNITYVKGTLTITQRSVSITAPSYNSSTLTYNGSAQTVASGGSCGDGGTMYYYISTSNSTPTFSTSTWSTSSNVQATNAGTYYVWYYCQVTDTTNNSGSGINTVTKISSPASKVINQKAVTVTAPSGSKVYDGTALTKSSGATLSGQVSGHTLNSVSYGGTITNVGSADCTVSNATIYSGSTNVTSNYSITYTKGTLTVSARPINVTASSASKTYDGSALTSNSATAESTGTNRGLASGHSMTSCTVTGTITNVGSADNVASAAVIKSGSTDVTSNYNITYVKGTLTVSARSVTITAPSYNSSTLTYNGSAQTVASGGSCTTGGTMYYYISTTNSTPTFSISTWSTSSNVQATNAGTYYVWYYCRVTDTTNNTGSGINTVTKISSPASKVINQKAVTVTGSSASKVYDGTALTKSTGATISGQVSGHTLASCTLTGSQTAKGSSNNVPSVATINDGNGNNVTSNYSITYANGTLTVSARPINVTASSASRAYNGSALTSNSATAEATGTNRGLVSGHSMTSYTVTGTITNVGSVDNVASAAVIKDASNNTVTSNYDITYVKGTLTITQRSVSITAPSYNSSTLTYNGSAQTVASGGSCTTGGTMYYYISTSNSTPTFSTSTWSTSANVQATNAGTYYVWYYCQVTDTTNNTGSGINTVTKISSPASKVINQKAVTVTAASDSKTYDGTALTKNSASLSGQVSGHTLATYTVTGSQTTKGSSNNVPSAATINDGNGNNVTSNYSITYTNGTLTVSARPIKVTASSASRAYNGSALTSNSATAEATGSGRGLVSGHSMTSCTVTGSQTTVGSSANVPSAAVIKSGSTDVTSNYDITYVNGTLEVTSGTLTVTATAYNATYDGASHNGITSISAKNQENTVVTPTYTYCLTENGTYTNTIPTVQGYTAGTIIYWKATLTGYTTASGSVSAKVNKKSCTVTGKSSSKVYDGSALTLASASVANKATLSNVVTGHTLAGVTASGTITNVGSTNNSVSSATINDGNGNNVTSNYSITYTAGTLTVTARSVTVTAASATKAYDGSALTANSATASAQSGTTGMLSSHHLHSVTVTGTQTAVGSSNNIASEAKIYSGTHGGTETDVTSNYSITYTNGTLEVTSGTLTVTATPYNATYDGSSHNAITSISTKNQNNTAVTPTYTYSTDGTNYSTTMPTVQNYTSGTTIYYKATLTGYTTATGSVVAKVNKKSCTVTAGSSSRDYNGSALTNTNATATGLITGQHLHSWTCTGSQTYAGSSDNVASNAKIYSGTHNGTESDVTSNYSITYTKGTLTITKADPDIAISGITADYTGGLFYATLTSTKAKGTLYWKKGAVATSSDTAVAINTTGSPLSTPINITSVKDNSDDFWMYWYFVPSSTATITSGHTYAENYNTVGGTSSDKVNLVINPRSITNVTASATTVTYDGTTQTASVSVTDSGATLTANDYTISDNTGKNAGGYTITITGKNNYTGTKTITWTINKRNVTIVAGSTSKTYDGSALTYNSASVSNSTPLGTSDHLHSYSISGTQTIAGSSDNVVSNAKIYSGTHSGTESDASSNYTISYTKGTLTVNKRAITATATTQTKEYDGTKLTATNTGSTDYNLASISHTITYSCTGEIGPNVSSGTKTLSSVTIKNSGGTDVTSSFTVTKVNGSLSIITKSCTVTYSTVTDVSEYCTDTANAYSSTDVAKTLEIATTAATSNNTDNTATIIYSTSKSGWTNNGTTLTIPANTAAGTYNITVSATSPATTNFGEKTVTNNLTVIIDEVELIDLNMTLAETTIAYGSSTTVSAVIATYNNGAYKDVKNDLTPNASSGNRINAADTTIVSITTT